MNFFYKIKLFISINLIFIKKELSNILFKKTYKNRYYLFKQNQSVRSDNEDNNDGKDRNGKDRNDKP